MRNGTNQLNRFSPALKKDFFQVDERSVRNMIQFTLQYAEKIKYFNFQNKPTNNWKPFFLNDPLFLFALIAGTEIYSYKSNNDTLLYKLKETNSIQKNGIENQLSENILNLANKVWVWRSLLESTNYRGALLKEIKNIQNYLKGEIPLVLGFQKKYKPSDFDIFGTNFLQEPEVSHFRFGEIFKSTYKSILFVKEFGGKRFETEYFESKFHHPHIGLLLAFFRLFQEIQSDINTFTGKHLDFYYKKLLGQGPLPGRFLTAIIGINPVKKPFNWHLPAAQKIRLTLPDKQELDFETLFEAPVNQARISEILIFFQGSYRPFEGSVLEESTLLNRLYESKCFIRDILDPGHTIKDVSGNYPMVLGEDQNDKGPSEQTMKESEIGWAVSSPVLILDEGNVVVTLSIGLVPSSLKLFSEQLFKLQKLKEGLSRSKSGETPISERERIGFVKTFLKDSFILLYTAAEGWLNADSLFIHYMEEENCLEISFELLSTEARPFPYFSDVHGGDFNTSWPMVKITLSNQASLHPYKIIKVLEASDISLTVEVKGVENVTLSNQFGKLDWSSPFQPFGPLPSQGSYLRIKNPFIFHKYLHACQLHLKWSGLPASRRGFKDYYGTYPSKLDNDSFKGEISFQKGKQPSKLKEASQEINLFQVVEKVDGNYLTDDRSVLIDPSLFDFEDDAGLTERERERNKNVMQLTLSQPYTAFGHQIYPELYSSISMQNSRYKRRNLALPLLPYTPVLEHLLINYTNYTKENLSRGNVGATPTIKIFHLYPFGQVQVYPSNYSSISHLIPQINKQGYLFFGLENVRANENLNIGIELKPALFPITAIHPPKLDWEYLDKNNWIPLGNLLLEDNTSGMIQSGVVKIKLPNNLDMNNTRFAKGKFWLRVTSKGGTILNSRLINVFANALKVRSRAPFIPERYKIDQLKMNKVALIEQHTDLVAVGPFAMVFPSFTATEDDLYPRTSEILRHKKKPSSNWDYERLVLDNFPEIGRIMVYGRSSSPDKLMKGTNIQVVVMARSSGYNKRDLMGRKVTLATIIAIKNFLSSITSPYARFEVSNPVLEQLKVRCSVKFTNPEQSGYYLEVLKNELIDFISSDSSEMNKESGFLQSIYLSEILDFMESRSYVDFVTGYSVLQIVEVEGEYNVIDTAKTFNGKKIEILRTISPYAILTSASEHHINILTQEEFKEPILASIGDLSIDSDFVVKKSD